MSEELVQAIVQAMAEGHYEKTRKAQAQRAVFIPAWDQLAEQGREHIKLSCYGTLAPALPVIDHAVMQAAEEASVLRMHLGLFIDELKGRGDAVLAAELATVINPKD